MCAFAVYTPDAIVRGISITLQASTNFTVDTDEQTVFASIWAQTLATSLSIDVQRIYKPNITQSLFILHVQIDKMNTFIVDNSSTIFYFTLLLDAMTMQYLESIRHGPVVQNLNTLALMRTYASAKALVEHGPFLNPGQVR